MIRMTPPHQSQLQTHASSVEPTNNYGAVRPTFVLHIRPLLGPTDSAETIELPCGATDSILATAAVGMIKRRQAAAGPRIPWNRKRGTRRARAASFGEQIRAAFF